MKFRKTFSTLVFVTVSTFATPSFAHDSYFGTGLYLLSLNGGPVGTIAVCHNKWGKGKVGINKRGKRYRIVHTKHGMRMATDWIGTVVFSKEGGLAKLSVKDGPKIKGRWAMIEKDCKG